MPIDLHAELPLHSLPPATEEQKKLWKDIVEDGRIGNLVEGKLVKLVVERCQDRAGTMVIGTYRQITLVIQQLQYVGVVAKHAPWSFEHGTWLTIISDEVCEKHKQLVEDWMNMPAEDPKAAQETPKVPEYIDYGAFEKVELVVGKILTAERIPKKDKLLKLTVDIGEPTPRTIVAGLGQTFHPETLLGLQVAVVANLAPRDFGKGLVSHGMILATGESTSLSLVQPTGLVPNGSRLK